jgi:hypothetical protein
LLNFFSSTILEPHSKTELLLHYLHCTNFPKASTLYLTSQLPVIKMANSSYDLVPTHTWVDLLEAYNSMEYYDPRLLVVQAGETQLYCRLAANALVAPPHRQPKVNSSLKSVPCPMGSEGDLFLGMVPDKCAALAIATVAVKFLQKHPGSWTSDQQAAYDQFFNVLTNDMAICDDAWPSQYQLQAYFIAMDGLFFAGKLWPHVSVESMDPNDPRIGTDWAVTINNLTTPKTSRILINHGQGSDLGKPALERRDRVLGSLLHEMAHALIYVYHCRCNGCFQAIGLTGHGSAWENIAHAINTMFCKVLQETGYEKLQHVNAGDFPDLLGIEDGVYSEAQRRLEKQQAARAKEAGEDASDSPSSKSGSQKGSSDGSEYQPDEADNNRDDEDM